MEVKMQNAINVFKNISHEKALLAANTTPDKAIYLEKKSHNQVLRATYARNNDIPKACFDFKNAAETTYTTCKENYPIYIL